MTRQSLRRCRRKMTSYKFKEWAMVLCFIAGVLLALPGFVIAAPFFWAAIRLADHLGEEARR